MSVISDEFEKMDRVYLERLRLAAGVILELAEDEAIDDILVTELDAFRERVERALLMPVSASVPGGPGTSRQTGQAAGAGETG